MTKHPIVVGLGLSVALLVTGCGGAAPHPAAAPIVREVRAVSTGATDQTASGISAQGTGTISGSPNVLSLQIGVEVTAAHAADAMAKDASKAQAVINSLKSRGVATADIQTGELSLYPNYNPSGVVTDYQVTNTLTAKLRDLSGAGATIDAAVAAAGDAGRLQGVSFSLDDSSALVAQARTKAVQAARAQAQQLADAAGVKLGSLRSLSEVTDQSPYPVRFGAAMATPSAPAPTPIQPGTQELRVQVTATWNVA